MAHDLHVGVIKGEHASAREQVTAARVATVLVLVSPNMTYPLKVKADAEKVVAEAPAKRAEEMWDELYVRQNTGIYAE